jgi:lantibiotic biosynthesis protein
VRSTARPADATPAADVAPAQRRRAAQIVDVLAGKLADPERVAAVATAPGNTVTVDTRPRSLWAPVALTDGHPAVALLFAELGELDAAHRRRAHAHLAAALAGHTSAAPLRLYGGSAALAFAGHAAASNRNGYATMLAELDRVIAGQARQRAVRDRDRVLGGEPIGTWTGYDVITGAAGIGRYLLGRYEATADPATGEALADVLATLATIALAPDLHQDGRQLPAWWADNGGWHLNLGLAHGVCGPLALLALACRAGVGAGQLGEAAAGIVELLVRWRRDDANGPYWPRRIPIETYCDPAAPEQRSRDVWCHGAAGIGRALYLAGEAFGQPDWIELAHAALRAAIRTASEPLIPDHALCHGWAGLLHIVSRMAADTGDPGYLAAAHTLAGRVLDGFDEAAPFGYRFPHPLAVRPLDRPGLLDGATGVALGLHSYTTGPSRTPWEAALLVA